MTETEQRLIAIHGSSTLNTEQLARELHYAGPHVVRDLVAKRRFPVRTYKLGQAKQSPLVADVTDVAAYLDSMRTLTQTPLSVRGPGAYSVSGSSSRGAR